MYASEDYVLLLLLYVDVGGVGSWELFASLLWVHVHGQVAALINFGGFVETK